MCAFNVAYPPHCMFLLILLTQVSLGVLNWCLVSVALTPNLPNSSPFPQLTGVFVGACSVFSKRKLSEALSGRSSSSRSSSYSSYSRSRSRSRSSRSRSISRSRSRSSFTRRKASPVPKRNKSPFSSARGKNIRPSPLILI